MVDFGTDEDMVELAAEEQPQLTAVTMAVIVGGAVTIAKAVVVVVMLGMLAVAAVVASV